MAMLQDGRLLLVCTVCVMCSVGLMCYFVLLLCVCLWSSWSAHCTQLQSECQ